MSMARLLALVMMLTLMISHGSSGAALVHHSPAAHGHESQTSGHDQHHRDLTQEPASEAERDDASKSSPGHVHMSADFLPSALWPQPVGQFGSETPAAASQFPLASEAVPPLLEPPSA